MISFSSISHINFRFFMLVIGSNFRKFTITSMMVTHSVSSVLMFSMVGLVTHSCANRIIFYRQCGAKSMEQNLVFFVGLLNNMGVPACVSFLPEFFSMVNLFDESIFSCLLGLRHMLLICFMSLYMFSNSGNNQNFSQFSFLVATFQVLNWSILMWV